MTTYTLDSPLVSIVNVTKKYGNKQVLSPINLTLRDLHCSDRNRVVGQVTCLLGPSGCGKSTLLRLIAGLEKPTTGDVFLDDDTVPVHAGQVGVIFQNYEMFRHRTVLGNLKIAGKMAGMTDSQANGRANEYLAMFGLSTCGDKYPAELSGGMRQRIAISRQLMSMDGPAAHPTRLLLMDEPFSALDPQLCRTTCRLIRQVADMDDARSIILVTHDLRSALTVSDHAWVMAHSDEGGKIVKDVSLAELEMAWDPEAFHSKAFLDMEAELQAEFATL